MAPAPGPDVHLAALDLTAELDIGRARYCLRVRRHSELKNRGNAFAVLVASRGFQTPIREGFQTPMNFP
jgi:hypothetical protein